MTGSINIFFLRRFASKTVVLTSARREECLDFMKKYRCSSMACEDCFACPLNAVGAAVGTLAELRAEGILVRVGGQLAGGCIVSCGTKWVFTNSGIRRST